MPLIASRATKSLAVFLATLRAVVQRRAQRVTHSKAPFLDPDQAAVMEAFTAAAGLLERLGITDDEMRLFLDPAHALFDAGNGRVGPLLTFRSVGHAPTIDQIFIRAWTGAASRAIHRAAGPGALVGDADKEAAGLLSWFDDEGAEAVAQRFGGRPTRWNVRDARLEIERNDDTSPVVLFARSLSTPGGLLPALAAEWFRERLGPGGGVFTA